MKWEVRGAKKRTGEDVVKTYTAASEEAAGFLAHEDGIVVSSIELLIDMDAVHSAREGSQASAPVASYATPKSRSITGVPDYAGLTVAGGVLRIYAYVCYAIASISLLIALIGLVSALLPSSRGSGLELVPLTALLVPALGIFFAAAASHGLGAACVALRDIARNSWT